MLPDRYAIVSRIYDIVSGEWPLYGAGRRAGISALRVAPGDCVVDLGCGTGLNFAGLVGAVGPEGLVIGVDRSSAMLGRARARARRHGWRNVVLITADATSLEPESVRRAMVEHVARAPHVGAPKVSASQVSAADAVFATYALSLMPHWPEAWERLRLCARPSARAAVVDLRLPRGAARVFAPLARLACALGGSDPHAHPWTALERDCTEVVGSSLRGGPRCAQGYCRPRWRGRRAYRRSRCATLSPLARSRTTSSRLPTGTAPAATRLSYRASGTS